MAEWSSTTQVLTEEQRFYREFGMVASMVTMDYLWREIVKYQKKRDKLDADHFENKQLYAKIMRNLNIQKHLYPILKKQHDANRIVRSTLCPSTYEIYCYGRERTVCDPT